MFIHSFISFRIAPRPAQCPSGVSKASSLIPRTRDTSLKKLGSGKMRFVLWVFVLSISLIFDVALLSLWAFSLCTSFNTSTEILIDFMRNIEWFYENVLFQIQQWVSGVGEGKTFRNFDVLCPYDMSDYSGRVVVCCCSVHVLESVNVNLCGL